VSWAGTSTVVTPHSRSPCHDLFRHHSVNKIEDLKRDTKIFSTVIRLSKEPSSLHFVGATQWKDTPSNRFRGCLSRYDFSCDHVAFHFLF